ncbi:MAG: TolC family protein [Alphaproteobacteria bacterium]|nr:TolC family protein [Alphaproteobacteria bacterium]
MLVFTCVTALSAPSVAETVSESVLAALKSHPALDAKKSMIDAAHNNVWEQKSGFFPTLSVNAKAGREYMNSDTTRGVTGAGATSWVGEGSFVITQPLFTGFRVLGGYEAAKYRKTAAWHDLGSETEDLALRAARAHLNLMRTSELLDQARAYYAEIEKRHESIGLMLSEGVVDEAEILQADEILLSARNTRLGYEEAFRQAEADYLEAVGTIRPENLSLGKMAWEQAVPQEMTVAVDAALQNNPALHAATNTVTAAEKDVTVAQSDLVPQVDAEMSYTKKDQDDRLGGEFEDAAAMLRLRWNFSYGGGQLARIARGKNLKAEAEARRRAAERDITHIVQQKFTAMDVVDRQFKVLQERESAMQKIMNSFTSQFEAGRQSNLQLISAQARLFEAGAARVDAFYRRHLSRFELLSAMGLLHDVMAGQPVKTAAQAKEGG